MQLTRVLHAREADAHAFIYRGVSIQTILSLFFSTPSFLGRPRGEKSAKARRPELASLGAPATRVRGE
jgi:hypothetical protein